jgi:hypothetical protein
MGAPIRKTAKTNNMVERLPMQSLIGNVSSIDQGGRRRGVDRRRFSYTCFIPERRSGADRRCGQDRRRKKRPDAIPEIESRHQGALQGQFGPP